MSSWPSGGEACAPSGSGVISSASSVVATSSRDASFGGESEGGSEVHPSTTTTRLTWGGGPRFMVKARRGLPLTRSPSNNLEYFAGSPVQFSFQGVRGGDLQTEGVHRLPDVVRDERQTGENLVSRHPGTHLQKGGPWPQSSTAFLAGIISWASINRPSSRRRQKQYTSVSEERSGYCVLVLEDPGTLRGGPLLRLGRGGSRGVPGAGRTQGSLTREAGARPRS